MAEPKAIKECIVKASGLTLLGFLSAIVNILEISALGTVCAGTAMLITINYQFFQGYLFILLPIVYVSLLVISAIPGFFTVLFISNLAQQYRTTGVVIVAVIGITIWIGFSAICSAMVCPAGSAIFAGLILNVLGQFWAAIWIMRKKKKVHSVAVQV